MSEVMRIILFLSDMLTHDEVINSRKQIIFSKKEKQCNNGNGSRHG